MLGLFGFKKTPGELALKEVEKDAAKDAKYKGSGFDPTGLERAAKAAREIDASKNAALAFDVIQQQEMTKQIEHQTRQAAYEMQARQYEMGRVKDEAEEARRTLAAQTEHANRQAKYQDELERQRYAAQIQAQRDVREQEMRRQEEHAKRQEALRRSTLQYEATLREATELARAKAEAEARARAERQNHDLSLERMRVEMKEKRETLLESIRLGATTLGDGAKQFLGDPKQMTAAVGLASALALGVYGARHGAGVTARYVEARLGKPSLVRETSRAAPLAALANPVKSARALFAPAAPADALDGVILAPAIDARLRRVAASTKNTKANKAPFRHLLLHGPPGTGKTLFAKKLAQHSGLDYAILTGGDVAPLGRDAVTEIHRLFDWARASSNGLLLFVDEADAFLRRRTSETMSEDLRNAFNAFLYRTGEESKDFMLVYASNTPEDFDWAINDRVDEMVEFQLPGPEERERLLKMYVEKYLATVEAPGGLFAAAPRSITLDGVDDAHLKAAVRATEGFSGREIAKLAIAWQAAAYGTDGAIFTPPMLNDVLDTHVAQRLQKARWAA
ncbi:hypothetical protein M885DRAFT_613389 [Pelagophyceae sp. CCMP2097]|nr:hypothetical protein M885DRAFT_613389 [Pelagophyceae sp. CCMP2097]